MMPNQADDAEKALEDIKTVLRASLLPLPGIDLNEDAS